jgi:aarF domain-containing kinase
MCSRFGAGTSRTLGVFLPQDNVAPFSNAAAFAILDQELARPAAEVFSSLSDDPVASASLGQVYKGVLRPEWGGHTVAVKVQRPGAAASIALDFRVLRQTIGVVQRAAGLERDLRGLTDEVGTALQGECDFRNEAANAAAFGRAHAGLPFVLVPRVVEELTSRRVLVSQWVDGRSPTQLLAGRAADVAGADAAGILSMVRMGIQCSLAQLLVTGCMHGDPHSGNLLLARDGRLCYLDFGLIVRVSPQHRQAMMAALVHLGLGEWRRLVGDLAELDLLKPGTDQAALAEDLRAEFSAVLASAPEADGGGGALQAQQLPLLSLQSSSLSFSTLAGVLFRVAFKYRFLLPSYFPLVVRSVSSLEGVALSIDPGFKLVSAGMPVVLNQLLSDRRPVAQALLRELLLAPGGGLRTDDTTQQILRVWLSAAQQAAAGDALASVDEMPAPPTPGDAAADMTSLLLDRRNVPLRRTLMGSNPAATIASMPPATREQLLRVLTEALSSQGGSAAAAGLLERSPAGRAQRKRLAMLVKASVPKVITSPPSSILQLVAFTAAVVAAVLSEKVRQAWQAVAEWVAALVGKLRGGGAGRPAGAAP